MSTRPYELLARFSPDGTVAGVSVRTITTVGGRDYESDPTPLSGATDAAFVAFAEQFAASVVSERDTAAASLETQRATMQAEIDRLTALIHAPVADYMITPAVFVERLEAASPGVIDRLWSSDTKEAGRLAVTLFTWSDRIDCRPGGRLEGYLNLIVQMGFMDSDSVAKVWA
jgi:hypothetical protein